MTSISHFSGRPKGTPLTALRRATFAAAALLTVFVAGPATRAGTTPAEAHPQARGLVQIDNMATGSLLFKTTEGGKYLEAPRLKTDIQITVTGPIARARITQRFENPSDKWVEGVYVFPLPQNAGVDTLKMQVGSRFLEGDVKERQQARQIYERAAAAGIKTALIEQQRPNMFTNSVANIGPHETVVVQIEYQEAVRLDGGKFSLRVPLVVGPRYSPQPRPEFTGVAYDDSQTLALSDPVPDRLAITPPVLHPARGKINPVTLKVALNAGVSLAAVESQFHKASVTRHDDKSATVELEGRVPADRDFVLN